MKTGNLLGGPKWSLDWLLLNRLLGEKLFITGICKELIRNIIIVYVLYTLSLSEDTLLKSPSFNLSPCACIIKMLLIEKHQKDLLNLMINHGVYCSGNSIF